MELKYMLAVHSTEMSASFLHEDKGLQDNWRDILEQKLGAEILGLIEKEAEPLTEQDVKHMLMGDEPEQMAVLGRHNCRLLYTFFGDMFNGYHAEVWK